jgi:hypothetical protein
MTVRRLYIYRRGDTDQCVITRTKDHASLLGACLFGRQFRRDLILFSRGDIGVIKKRKEYGPRAKIQSLLARYASAPSSENEYGNSKLGERLIMCASRSTMIYR